MRDDYLWDQTGEPDPDIQRLEHSLGRFRHKPFPPGAVFDRQLPPRRSAWRPGQAAAAALILIALAGTWVLMNRAERPQTQSIAQDIPQPPQPDNSAGRDKSDRLQPASLRHAPVRAMVKPLALRRKPVELRKSQPERIARESGEPAPSVSELAVVQPLVIPFVDVETSKHIERSQMLLRAFRNRDGSDVAYEREQSRGLLYQNIVLRRDAQAKGNMPVEDLLGSLEPFLIDIANLPEKPSKDDVSAIKERMRKKEILSALQIYSAPTLSQVFK